MNISNFAEALELMSTEEQYKQAGEAIIGPNASFKAGTPEYYELARIRQHAKMILMGIRNSASDLVRGFPVESNALAGNGYKCMPNCN